jgi:cell division protein FtsB
MISCYYGGNTAENYRQGYEAGKKDNSTVQGLKDAMDVMEQRIYVLEEENKRLREQIEDMACDARERAERIDW